MATFTDVYKQELKNKGVLSSLGSTMFKRSKERLDPRNILFGGSGMTSAIGQKIFGKGYSALNSSSSGKVLNDGRMQSQALNALVISSKNQEAQLSIIAKNSMNNNAMSRDMNLMRQNIMKLVTISGGKASRRADMFFKDASAREAAYESKFGKSTSPVPINVDSKKESSGLLSTLIKSVGAISVAILALGTKLVSELGGIIRSALETLGNVLKSALLGKAVSDVVGRGGGGVVPGKSGPGGKNKSRFGLKTGIAGILAGLGIYFSDEIIDYIDGKLVDAGLKNPSVKDSLDPGEEIMGDGSTSIKDYIKPVGSVALAGATAVGAAKFISSKSPVKGYNPKAGRFVGSTGKFVAASQIPAGKLIDKLFKFAAKLSSKPGLMSKFLALVSTKIGGSLALKITTFFGGLVVPGPGWIISLLSAGLLIADVYIIYDAIFGPGGIAELLDEEEERISRAPSTFNAAKDSQAAETSPSRVANSKILEVLREAEGGKMAYDAVNRGKAGDTREGISGLSTLKVSEVMKLQADKKLFAAGAYQIIPDTLKELLQGVYGETGVSMDDTFDKNTQDKLGQTLVNFALKQAEKAGGGLRNQQIEFSKRWAAIADPDTGLSRYGNVGNNKASISATAQIKSALSGDALAQGSSALAAMTRDMNVAQAPNVVVNAPQTNVTSGRSSSAPAASATNVDALELFFQASM
jgi:hypothetical protein